MFHSRIEEDRKKEEGAKWWLMKGISPIPRSPIPLTLKLVLGTWWHIICPLSIYFSILVPLLWSAISAKNAIGATWHDSLCLMQHNVYKMRCFCRIITIKQSESPSTRHVSLARLSCHVPSIVIWALIPLHTFLLSIVLQLFVNLIKGRSLYKWLKYSCSVGS